MTKNEALILRRQNTVKAPDAWMQALVLAGPTILPPDHDGIALNLRQEIVVELRGYKIEGKYKDSRPTRPTLAAEFVTMDALVLETGSLQSAAIEEYRRSSSVPARHCLDLVG